MSLLLPYRPKKPVKEDPRAWWRYAYFCVKRATKSLGIAEVGDRCCEQGKDNGLHIILWALTHRIAFSITHHHTRWS